MSPTITGDPAPCHDPGRPDPWVAADVSRFAAGTIQDLDDLWETYGPRYTHFRGARNLLAEAMEQLDAILDVVPEQVFEDELKQGA